MCDCDTWKIIVHRDIMGIHDVDNPTCWCEPHVFMSDDMRTVEQLMDEIQRRELKQ